MNDPVALLKREHREVAVMLKALDASKPGARRRATVKKLVAALEVHMTVEESDVYPLVKRVVDDEAATEAGIEHRLVRDGLVTLHDLQDKPGFGAAVAMITAGIKHHVKEEEQEIFPELKARLDRSELAALGDVMAKTRAVARRAQRN